MELIIAIFTFIAFLYLAFSFKKNRLYEEAMWCTFFAGMLFDIIIEITS